MSTNTKPLQRSVVGVVTSDKMNKTRVVEREKKKPHPLYGKYVKTDTRFYADDAKEISKVGDVVRLVQVRPVSKKKCWSVVEIIQAAAE